MTMTASLSDEKRKRTAKKASIVAFITILSFAFTGQILFNFFGI
jgi:multiple antibiotic resistance protein